jgi:imidazolonepropionase-like amidohydrolase
VDESAKNLPYSAAFTVAEAIDPRSMRIQVNRAEGITAGLVAPEAAADSNGIAPIIAGQASFLRLKPGLAIDVRTPVGFVFTYGEAGADFSGGARSAALLRLRALLDDARDYAANREAFNNGARRDYTGTRQDLEALQPLLAGKAPLLAEVHRATDILVLLKVAREQRLKLVIVGGAEAWEVAPQLAAAKVPVVLDVFNNLPDSFDMLGATFENAARLNAAGVEIAFAYAEHYNPRNARQLAGNAVSHGLPFDAALAAITRNPARIYGLGNTLGTLEAGKTADLVVWDGDPLETTSMTTQVYVGGEQVPNTSRQTLLRDRYRTPRGTVPPAYVHPGAK